MESISWRVDKASPASYFPVRGIMLSPVDREKVAKLPTWARELIKRLEYASQPAIEEAAKCRKKAEAAEALSKRLYDANNALMELLSNAGKAGLDWAAVTVSVLESYEIFRGKSEE